MRLSSPSRVVTSFAAVGLLGVAAAALAAEPVEVVAVSGFSGTATDITIQREPGGTGGVEFRVRGVFAAAVDLDLGKTALVLDEMFSENGSGGAGELITMRDDLSVFPGFRLEPRAGSPAHKALYESPSQFRPHMRHSIQKKRGLYEFRFKLDRGLARRGPNLCALDPNEPNRTKTQMTLAFALVSLDGSAPDVRVTTTQPWECPQPGRFHMRARPKATSAGDGSSGDTPDNKAPQVNYTVAPRRGPAPLTAQFTDTSSDDGAIVSHFWDFGDGTTSTEASPSHTYLAAGDYDVVHRVVDDKGATATKAESEKVRVDPPR